MTQFLFRKPEERSFTLAIARGRFLWLFVASLLLPVAATLSHSAKHSEQFETFIHTDSQVR